MITNDDNLWSWGRNDFGQLCHGDTEDRSIPQKTSFSNISKISAGWDHSLFQNNKGEIFSCGNNDFGQLGQGDKVHLKTPKVNTLKDIQQISYGSCGFHFFAKNSQNQIFVSGDNYNGQLGTGDTKSVSIPKEFYYFIG